jgi:ribosome assembly protein RRB1
MEMEECNDEGNVCPDNPQVYLPGQIGEDEELIHDKSAYYMYHNAQSGAPCLSFDILRDGLGDKREDYPMTMYLVAGTQAQKGKQNFVILMKMSHLQSTYEEKNDDDEAEDDDDDELDDDEPQLDTMMIQHPGTVNRLRIGPVNPVTLVSTWSDVGKVHLWDVTKQSHHLDSPTTGSSSVSSAVRGHKIPPLFTFTNHQVEGYAMDWNGLVAGRLATGDTNGMIYVWDPHDRGSTWVVGEQPYSSHSSSVEDIQWSPNENTVFASCSVDCTIRIWDIRARPDQACMITAANAHDTDINVIHWNKMEPLIVSGCDQGIIKIWDLRQIQSNKPAGLFNHHGGPITSVEWNPFDSTVFASAGADDQVLSPAGRLSVGVSYSITT